MADKQNYFIYIDNTSDNNSKIIENLRKQINYEQNSVIIDGVDVSRCESFCNGICCKVGFGDDASCKLFSDCNYKQLKRKEQSEKKLVNQIQTICDFINNRPETFKGINGSVDKIITDYAERKEQEYEELRKHHNKCCEEFEKEKKEWLEKYNQVSRDFYNGKYCDKENCNLLKTKEQECEELKNTVMQRCPQCGDVYLNPIGCELYEQLDQLESENEELKKIIERLDVPKHEVIDMDIALENEKLKAENEGLKEKIMYLESEIDRLNG